MHTHNNAPVCAITSADLDAIKTVLELILGDDLKSTHRLEIFARLAGYRTYAALRTDLEEKIDIFGDPLPTLIYANPRKNDPFITGLPIDVRRKLAMLEQVGILRMVAVALQMSHDPVFGNIGIVRDDLEEITRIAMKEHMPRQTLAPGGSLPEGRLLLVTSPANLAELKTAAITFKSATSEGESIQVNASESDLWHMGAVTIAPASRFFENPSSDQITTIGKENLADLTELPRDANLVFFSDEDCDCFAAFVKQHLGRAVDPRRTIAIQRDALEIEDWTEGTFFEAGYYGTARNDLPDNADLIDGMAVVSWISEIANVVHGCAYEYKRIFLGNTA